MTTAAFTWSSRYTSRRNAEGRDSPEGMTAHADVVGLDHVGQRFVVAVGRLHGLADDRADVGGLVRKVARVDSVGRAEFVFGKAGAATTYPAAAHSTRMPWYASADAPRPCENTISG